MLSNTGDMQSIQKLVVNANNLRKCWSINNIISKEDWLEWLRHLSIGFLTESNSPALRYLILLIQSKVCWTINDE
jgi:serine/threonine-protein kinase mTOR